MLLQFFALWDDLLSIYRIRSLSISMLGLFSKSICFYFPVQSIFGVPGVHLSKDPGYRSSAFSHNSGKSRRQSMLLWGSKRFWKIPKKIFWKKKNTTHLLNWFTNNSSKKSCFFSYSPAPQSISCRTAAPSSNEMKKQKNSILKKLWCFMRKSKMMIFLVICPSQFTKFLFDFLLFWKRKKKTRIKKHK